MLLFLSQFSTVRFNRWQFSEFHYKLHKEQLAYTRDTFPRYHLWKKKKKKNHTRDVADNFAQQNIRSDGHCWQVW